MSSGERPIGAAKGTQSDTEALCQYPPPPVQATPVRNNMHNALGNLWRRLRRRSHDTVL